MEWGGNVVEMNTILVTGGAGFIGSHLCQALLERGGRVVSIDNFNDFYDPGVKRANIGAVEETARRLTGNGCSFISHKADIRDAGELERLFATVQPVAVVHLAACAGVRPSIANPAQYYEVNVNGTGNLLECMKRHDVKRLVFASSSSVYGNNSKVPFSEDDPVDRPISPYAATKKAGELLCHVYHQLYGMSIACLRFFTVYGPRQRPDLAIRTFTHMIDAGMEIPFYGDGSTERDYTYIDDIISGVMGALDWTEADEARYDIFNLGEARTISLSELVCTLEETLGKRAIRSHLPNQPGDVRRTNADISKARARLGYCPQIGFEEGVARFVAWYQAQGQAGGDET